MIAIDVDGVLANFDLTQNRLLKMLGLADVPESHEAPSWHYWEELLGKEKYETFWAHIKKTYNFWLTLEPYKRNIDALAKFHRNHPEQDILFLTSRIETAGFSAATQTEGWLRLQGIDSPFMTVQTCPSKDKAENLRLSNCTHFIDDRGRTIKQCLNVPGLTAVLHRRPWNTAHNVPVKVDSLGQFFQIVERSL